jgi:hypothetical protein
VTWTAAGSVITASSVSTFSLTPGGAGHLILLEVEASGSTAVWCTGVSSANVTWAPLTTVLIGANNTRTSVIYAGTVTAASAQTVTITWSSAPVGTTHIVGQEFSSTIGSWSLDKQGNLDLASGTATWPSLTPAAAGELYWGYCICSGSATTGSTSGYVYNASADGAGNSMAYNPACGAGATSPVWGNAVAIFGIAVLMTETAGAADPPSRVRVTRQAVKRASLW